MNFLRNTFAVILGLTVAALLITIGIRINSSWITYEGFSAFEKWESVLKSVEHKPYFFVALLISSGIAATAGGVVTAIIVKYAKVAYAILIGFILLFIATVFSALIPLILSFIFLAIYSAHAMRLSKKSKPTAQQGGAGYPPQSVGSPDP